MRRKRRSFTPEYKAEAVQFFRNSNLTISKAAQELGVSSSSLGRWILQAEIDEGKNPKGELTTSEKEELKNLRNM